MISIIIPTFNAGANFQKLLDALDCQTIKAGAIFIVDSGSNDGTVATAESRGCTVLTIDKRDFDHGTARNLPISSADTEFVVFLTQDAMPADKYMLAELIKPMQNNPSIAMCYGRQLPRPNATTLERFAREFNYPPESILKTKKDIETLGLKTFFCSNSCSAIRCSIFKKLGGFKNDVIVNEDMLFAAKAILHDYSVYYSAAAKVYHSHPYSLPQTFRRYFNIGRFFSDNKWILKHDSLKSYSSDMLRVGIRTFWGKRMLHYIFTLLIEFTIKAFAFKLGWYYQLLFHKKHDTHL